VCCGRAAVSKGLLDHARDLQTTLLDTLAPEVEAGVWIVGIEPSCILTLRDELPDLVRDGRNQGARRGVGNGRSSWLACQTTAPAAWSAAPSCTATATRRRSSAWSPRARC
jgi:hypothetical protein